MVVSVLSVWYTNVSISAAENFSQRSMSFLPKTPSALCIASTRHRMPYEDSPPSVNPRDEDPGIAIEVGDDMWTTRAEIQSWGKWVSVSEPTCRAYSLSCICHVSNFGSRSNDRGNTSFD